MRWIVVVVLMAAGCTHVNRATLVASSLALACDFGQTYSAAADGWEPVAGRTARWEANPIMGPRPSASVTSAYFFTALLANAVTWALMPRKLKSVVPLGVLALEAGPVKSNLETTRTVCGL